MILFRHFVQHFPGVFLVFSNACTGEDSISSPDKDWVDSPYDGKPTATRTANIGSGGRY